MAFLFQENVTNLSCDFSEIQVAGRFSRSDDNVITLGENGLVQTEKLPDEPFDPVSFDCVPYSLAYGNPQSGYPPTVLHQGDCKVSRTKSPAGSI